MTFEYEQRFQICTFWASALVFALVGATPAQAENRTIEAKSGAIAVGAMGLTYDPERCAAGPFQMRVTTPPENGTAKVVRVPLKMRPGDPCAGKTMKVQAIVYQSKAGFRGTDHFSYEKTGDTYSNGLGTTWDGGTVTINVK